MTASTLATIHDRLIKSNAVLHVTCTGAGLDLQRALWSTPGCSAYLAACRFPYSQAEVDRVLGFRHEGSSCSGGMAALLAESSYLAAARDAGGRPIVAVGVSAAAATTRVLKGGTRAHICVLTDNSIRVASDHLPDGPGAVARRDGDRHITRTAADVLSVALSTDSNKYDCAEHASRLALAPFFFPEGMRASDPKLPGLYLPGSFNPLHDGHLEMIHSAQEKTGDNVTLLLCADHPYKPGASYQELLRRIAAINNSCHSVMVTRGETLFLDIARARPGSTIIIGADTMQRMLDPQWGPEVRPMLDEFAALGVQFLVMGREIDGKWVTCRDVSVPWPRCQLFQPLPGRHDISSSELRGQA